ncbi:CAP domain-containing protein [Anabaena sp. CCY 0017]|uniref:CAP domain-containing protein n=1 Tax=Anabaena sp. CCY 0017 TaxID=3103866 RepID=UPI0039C5E6B0
MSIVKNFIAPFLTTKLFTGKNKKLSLIGLVVCSSLTASFLLPELSDTVSQQSASVAQAQQTQNSVSNQVIQLVNQARSQGRVCGNKRFNAASQVSTNSSLNNAAQVHSSDMAARKKMSHTGSNGSSLGQRATQAGYQWRAIAENVAAGQKSPSEVVQAWLKSPGHCANIMNSNYNEGGVSAVRGGDGLLYWTMMYGKR